MDTLRHRLSRYVTIKDALSCALVSKAWTYGFISAIWFKVDFEVQPLFADLSPDTIAKYGHHIRVVQNAKLPAQLSALDNPNVNMLRNFQVEATASTKQHMHAYQIVARNNTSIQVKREFARYFPRLTEFKLGEYDGYIAAELLSSIATKVTRVTFVLEHLTPETIEAILLHRATLKKVAHFYNGNFDYDKDCIAMVSRDLQVTDDMIQQIPRKCSQLQRMNLHRYVMDMDIIEAQEWICKDLRKLRIRIKGLDTKEKILKAISLWRAGCWRRGQKKSTGNTSAVAEEEEEEEERFRGDLSIEARVARHLLKFEHLQWVWLGYMMWAPEYCGVDLFFYIQLGDQSKIIWFKVDFEVHPLFTDLSPDIIAKYGHHIRVVKNAKLPEQVSALNNPNINKLRDMDVEVTSSAEQHTHAYQIIAMNNTSIRNLQLFTEFASLRGRYPTLWHVSVSAFDASQGLLSSTLETLELIGLSLTYDELLKILDFSPNLSKLRLYGSDISGSPTRSVQYPSVTLLAWSLSSIFPPGETCPLLYYFPNLTTLSTWKSSYNFPIPTARAKREFARYCPRLTEFKLRDHVGLLTAEFITDVVINTTRITFDLSYLDPESLTAILLHQATLTRVSYFHHVDFDYDKDQVAQISKGLQVTDEMIQQIPRKCSQLQRLNLPRHEMDMDIIEAREWICKDLRKLRIRIKGLDTKEKILKAISLWRAGCWRRGQKNSTGNTSAVAEEEEEEERFRGDLSIEARVARHLLKFEHLQWVWLGYMMWAPV
ncbi:hypothetical protein EC991_000227 [Linnemannia zychae]|nr:hypothetical protein EC991_000227 [Linnemannia zychae]